MTPLVARYSRDQKWKEWDECSFVAYAYDVSNAMMTTGIVVQLTESEKNANEESGFVVVKSLSTWAYKDAGVTKSTGDNWRMRGLLGAYAALTPSAHEKPFEDESADRQIVPLAAITASCVTDKVRPYPGDRGKVRQMMYNLNNMCSCIPADQMYNLLENCKQFQVRLVPCPCL